MKIQGNGFSILGIARTGVATARLLHDLGADVLISDDRPKYRLEEWISELPDKVEYETDGLMVRPGDVVIISPGIAPSSKGFRLAQRFGAEVISDIELFYRIWPGDIVAVTGTDGKSTVTSLTAHLLTALGQPAVAAGNIGKAVSTVPGRESPDKVVVLEVSSAQLLTSPGFRPRIALVTNIAEDHLSFHGNFDAYVEAKRRIIANQLAGDLFVRNIDDPIINEEFQPIGGQSVLDCSARMKLNKGVFLSGREIVAAQNGTRSIVAVREDLRLPGRYNAENALMAIGVAMGLGLDLDGVAAGLRTFKGLEHRMEFVAKKEGIKFINDSKATNPHAAAAGLRSLEGRVIAIVGGYNKGLPFDAMADALRDKVSLVVYTGPAGPVIAKAVRDVVRTEAASDIAGAVRLAFDAATWGDTVILSPGCSSFDEFEDFEDRGRQFKSIVHGLTGQDGQG